MQTRKIDGGYGLTAAPSQPQFMKKHASHPAPASPGSGPATSKSVATRAKVNAILRTAYRRHARGKIARAAMVACLGA
jgi:hypothetical protein